MRRLTNWFGVRGRADKADEGKPPGISLEAKYARYRELLAANGAILGLIGDMQAKLAEDFVFDMRYVTHHCEQISTQVGKLVQALIEMSGGRFGALRQAHRRVESRIQERLLPPKVSPGPLTYRLEAIPVGAFQVGGKAEKLGALARLGLPVPSGYVVTAYGQRLFFERSGLSGIIGRELAKTDPRDLESLRRVGTGIRQRLMEAEPPPELAAEIADQAASLGPRLAVRSSALHEDSHFSFAGQYDTELNVVPENLLQKYKEVLAGQFTSRALYYCHANGFSFEDMGMAVLIMQIVEARTAGVLYTADPEGRQEGVLINAVLGLGTLAVGGGVGGDIYRVDGDGRVEVQVGDKKQAARCLPGGGTVVRETESTARTEPCLSEEEARRVARLGQRAAAFFGCPQDMEWAIDARGDIFVLQSRPLRVKAPSAYNPPVLKAARLLIGTATIASRGSAAGPVHILGDEPEAAVPEGCILVARSPSPDHAVYLASARGLICEVGSATSHLATVCREAGLPALFGAKGARGLLREGQEVTVDALYGNVYQGRVEDLLSPGPSGGRTLRQTRSYLALEAVLKDIVPLGLTDPRSPEFRADNCATYHDITRFAHEMAMRELFEMPSSSKGRSGAVKRLASDLPLEISFLDLGGGLRADAAGRQTITPDDFLSRPLLAYWRGVRAVGWKGPQPVNFRGFLSVVLSASAGTNIRERLKETNYALVAAAYMNLSNRVGFHFAVIDSYLNDETDSHVSLTFYGGGAELARRVRRVEFLACVLRHLGFRVDLKEDALAARMEGYGPKSLEERLEILGRLMMVSKQMDMVMSSDAMAEHYAEEFIKGGYRLEP
ncbi:MAG: PEP/pyruvate-binding domain-containing protein [Pseudomonadota bacterium]